MRFRIPFASVLTAVGVALSILNLLGIKIGPIETHRRPITSDNPISGYHFPSRNIIDLQTMLERKLPRFDLEQVNRVVFESLVHAGDRRIQLHENWVMWFAGFIYEPASKTQSAHRIVSGGRAICSEAVAVINEISEINGVDARIVALNGHVVSEVHTNQGWQIADPDYGVVYSADLAKLQSGVMSTVMQDKLARNGFSDAEIARYIQFFESAEDNSVLETGLPSSPRLRTFERVSEWLKWILPGLLIFLGFTVIRRQSN